MELKHLTQSEFESVRSGALPAVIDFFADWCGPCRRLAPVMEALAERYGDRAVVAKVDVDAQPALAAEYGVSSIPTVVFLKDGREVERRVGVREHEEYAQTLERLL